MDKLKPYEQMRHVVEFLREAQGIRELEIALMEELDPVTRQQQTRSLRDGVKDMYGRYADVLSGTPERKYLGALSMEYRKPTKEDVRQFLDKTIDDVTLSTKSYNALKNNSDIRTMRQAVQTRKSELLRIHNFGKKSLNQLRILVGSYGLRLDMTADEVADFYD